MQEAADEDASGVGAIPVADQLTADAVRKMASACSRWTEISTSRPFRTERPVVGSWSWLLLTDGIK